MKKTFFFLVTLLIFSCQQENKNADSDANLKMAQSFMDNLLTDADAAKSLLHDEFTFSWMGTIEQGGVLWNKENLFTDYLPIIGEILPQGIILNTVDAIADSNGVALIQEGDAEGKNGEYDNKYVWIFKMKEGKIHSLREYNSDILVATQLYDYQVVPIE